MALYRKYGSREGTRYASYNNYKMLLRAINFSKDDYLVAISPVGSFLHDDSYSKNVEAFLKTLSFIKTKKLNNNTYYSGVYLKNLCYTGKIKEYITELSNKHVIIVGPKGTDAFFNRGILTGEFIVIPSDKAIYKIDKVEQEILQAYDRVPLKKKDSIVILYQGGVFANLLIYKIYKKLSNKVTQLDFGLVLNLADYKLASKHDWYKSMRVELMRNNRFIDDFEFACAQLDSDILKDLALSYELDGEINKALILMKKAQKANPNVVVIDAKIKEYESLLKITFTEMT